MSLQSILEGDHHKAHTIQVGEVTAPIMNLDLINELTGVGSIVEDVTHKDGKAYSLTDAAPVIDTEFSNKKYVDTTAAAAGKWDRTVGVPNFLDPKVAGDEVRCDSIRGQAATTIDVSGVTVDVGNITLNAGATCDNIDNDGTMVADSSTRLVTQSAAKTYTDNHSANGMWTRSGTDLYPSNTGDKVAGGTVALGNLSLLSTTNATKGQIDFDNNFYMLGSNFGSLTSDIYILANAGDNVTLRDSSNNDLLKLDDTAANIQVTSDLLVDNIKELTGSAGVTVEDILILDDDITGLDNITFLEENDNDKINFTTEIHVGVSTGNLRFTMDDDTKDVEFRFGGANRLEIRESGTTCQIINPNGDIEIDGGILANNVNLSNINTATWQNESNDQKIILKDNGSGVANNQDRIGIASNYLEFNKPTGSNGYRMQFGGTDKWTLDETNGVEIINDCDVQGILKTDTIQPSTSNADITIDALDTAATSTVYILNSDGGQLANLNVENDVTVSGVINVQNGILTDTVWNYTINGPLELDCVNTIQDSIVNIINSNVTYDAQLQINASTLVNAILDEDNMVSDSDKALATQQSIKAYVDSGAGVNWGDTRTSTSGAGLTHTIGASAPAGTKGFVTSLNATQTNPIVLYEANLGTSSASHTGFNCTGKLASNTNAFKFENTTQSGDTGTSFYSNVALNANTRHRSFYANCTTSSGSVNRTVNQFELIGSRTMASGLVRTDDYDLMNLSRYGVGSGAGTLTSLGAVLKIENGAGGVATNDSVKLLEMIQDVDSIGVCISITQNSLTSTNFRKLITEENTSISNWISDGATPNGSLNATAGDICLNGPSNKPYYCVGTTNWMELNSGSSNLFRATALLQSDVTGDGTNYTCLWGTENYDTGGNFASPNYTAVSDGKYSFGFKLLVSGVLAANISIDAKFVINSVIFDGGFSAGGVLYVGTHHLDGHIEIDMLDGQTCYVTLRSTGGTKVLDILNSSYFFAHRMAD